MPVGKVKSTLVPKFPLKPLRDMELDKHQVSLSPLCIHSFGWSCWEVWDFLTIHEWDLESNLITALGLHLLLHLWTTLSTESPNPGSGLVHTLHLLGENLFLYI